METNITIARADKNDAAKARLIAKSFGVAHVKTSTWGLLVGRQGKCIASSAAIRLALALKASGFVIEDESAFIELAAAGILQSFLVYVPHLRIQ